MTWKRWDLYYIRVPQVSAHGHTQTHTYTSGQPAVNDRKRSNNQRSSGQKFEPPDHHESVCGVFIGSASVTMLQMKPFRERERERERERDVTVRMDWSVQCALYPLRSGSQSLLISPQHWHNQPERKTKKNRNKDRMMM